jgi:FKBP-type peptidyl-prolyl cis-trans isomerase FkpA
MRSLVRVLAFAVLPLIAACGSSSTASPSIVTSSGPFTVTDVRVGTGTEATVGKTLSVNYSGWLYDTSKTEGKGTLFDSNSGRGAFQFVLGGNVIAGWNQGIVGMKVGGLRRIIIPPNLGYGAAGSGPIPPNATLIFDVELLAVQ